ncbi:MAG: hypothetical protein U5L01_07245 [Rheinheimera sp.]|nr:hypothetical protein [Rheinheimera sp.]
MREQQLPQFGDYQDAMRKDDAFLFHSVCSMYLNIGLLDARWMCQKVDHAWRQQQSAINTLQKVLFGKLLAGVNMCAACIGY